LSSWKRVMAEECESLMRRAKRASRRITYMLSVPIVRCGETLSLLASARRDCGNAGAPATRNSFGNPPGGGARVTVSPSRWRTARCAGPVARRIRLSDADPTELSPGWSHSSPASESQPSGLSRSAACAARHATIPFSQETSSASSEPQSRTHDRMPSDFLAKWKFDRMRDSISGYNSQKQVTRVTENDADAVYKHLEAKGKSSLRCEPRFSPFAIS